jgi:hypothetical protein
MNTKELGDIAVGFAISYYLSHGYEVCLPIGDKRSYDLIAEKDNNLSRVQIKYAGFSAKRNKCQAGLRITGGNQSYSYARKYGKDDFDILFIYTAKAECYIIPWKTVDIRNELTVDAEKYRKYKVI